ncbi:hypothetical protein TNCV_2047071 [Trichonephila clavipes]|uniref:Uncharacterized protein n=1 Tax=Trichonephila clavipes TaxID=2585209 RepID=A0A8X6SU57_TRICX|nr:hypothetical protein TNCV_2047071 [Trichonephila clavipes]
MSFTRRPGSGRSRQISRREVHHIGPLCLLEPYEGAWLKDIWDRGAHYVCCRVVTGRDMEVDSAKFPIRRLEIVVRDAIGKRNLGCGKSLEAKQNLQLSGAERQDEQPISKNISFKKEKSKRNTTCKDIAYSAGAF